MEKGHGCVFATTVVKERSVLMIDFIYRLNEVLPSWPTGTRRSLTQISEITKTSMPHVVQYLSEGLGKDIDVTGFITEDEAAEAVKLLSKRIQPEIEERERVLEERRILALRGLDRILEKVRIMQLSKNWYGAFRTLSYFAGQHENDLPPDSLILLCSETVRTGIKSKANMQELGQWLQKGVGVAMSQHSKDGVEDALDLIDAYGEYFLMEESGKGPLLLGNILAVLEEPAARYELWEEYKSLVGQLYPET